MEHGVHYGLADLVTAVVEACCVAVNWKKRAIELECHSTELSKNRSSREE